MSDTPESGDGGGVKAVYTGDQPNPILKFLQQPRILLLLLAGWSVLGFLTETITSNAIFLENHAKTSEGNSELELDGALGGFALGWEGIPLAVLYIYCFRSPDKHHNIFVLALIHMAAMAASQVYHLGAGDFSVESIIVPLAGSVGLGALAFANIFRPAGQDELLD